MLRFWRKHCDSEAKETKTAPPEQPREAHDAPETADAGARSKGQATKYAEPYVIGAPSPTFEPNAIAERYFRTPYRPDTVLDGWSTESFTIRAASVRGLLHRHNGAPRQDDFALLHLKGPDRLLVAVSDGVSSAPQSHIGATIAVRSSLQFLRETFESDEEIDWKELLRHTAWQIVEQDKYLFDKTEPDPKHAEAHLATTLLCALIDFSATGEATLSAVSVGDTEAWLLEEGVFNRIEGGKVDDGSPITSSAVLGLPQIPLDVKVNKLTISPGCILLIGTDGFGDPLGTGSGEVGGTFKRYLDQPPSMMSFGHLLDFSRETFDDDRTLVAVWIKPTRNSRPAETGDNTSTPDHPFPEADVIE